MIRNQRTCANYNCPNPPAYCEIDRFDLAGIKSVAFYDVCEQHMIARKDKPPSPSHEPRQYRKL